MFLCSLSLFKGLEIKLDRWDSKSDILDPIYLKCLKSLMSFELSRLQHNHLQQEGLSGNKRKGKKNETKKESDCEGVDGGLNQKGFEKKQIWWAAFRVTDRNTDNDVYVNLFPLWDVLLGPMIWKYLLLVGIFKLLTRIPSPSRMKPQFHCFFSFFPEIPQRNARPARVSRPSNQRWLAKPAAFPLSPPWSSALSHRRRGSVSCSCSRKPDNDLSPVFSAADCLRLDTLSFVCLLRLSASRAAHFFPRNAQWYQMLCYFRVACALRFSCSRPVAIRCAGWNGLVMTWEGRGVHLRGAAPRLQLVQNQHRRKMVNGLSTFQEPLLSPKALFAKAAHSPIQTEIQTSIGAA